MAVIVEAPPYAVFTCDFLSGESIGELIQRIKDENSLEFRGAYSVQDEIQSGRVCSLGESVMDGRVYYLSVAIAS